MAKVNVTIDGIILHCDNSVANINIGNGYRIEKKYFSDLDLISKQFLDLTLCNSANGGKACIYGLFRHLLYGRTIRI